MSRLARHLARIPALDYALALALTLAVQVEVWAPTAAIGTGEVEGSRPVLSLTSLVLTLALAARRTAPLASNVAVMGAAAAQALLTAPTEGLSVLIALLLSAFSVAAYCDRTRALAGAAVTAAALVPASGDLADWAFGGLLLGGAWLAGRVLRRRTAQVATLEREQEAAALRAVEEERNRIARELHDVVSHRVSTIVVQAQAADALLDRDPDGTRTALRAIDESGRQALTELRFLLGLLRDGEHDPGRHPSPDLARLPELVEETRAAGMPVTLEVDGTPFAVPASVGGAAYRVVQEALTNALKHAGGAPTRVVLRYERNAVEVLVADDGTGPVNGHHAGHGLAGMRERVAVFGGSIETGPRPDGGFAVRARLPVEAGPS